MQNQSATLWNNRLHVRVMLVLRLALGECKSKCLESQFRSASAPSQNSSIGQFHVRQSSDPWPHHIGLAGLPDLPAMRQMPDDSSTVQPQHKADFIELRNSNRSHLLPLRLETAPQSPGWKTAIILKGWCSNYLSQFHSFYKSGIAFLRTRKQPRLLISNTKTTCDRKRHGSKYPFSTKISEVPHIEQLIKNNH